MSHTTYIILSIVCSTIGVVGIVFGAMGLIARFTRRHRPAPALVHPIGFNASLALKFPAPEPPGPLKGGNLTFQTGVGQRVMDHPPWIGENGDFIFQLGSGADAIEMLRVCGDGRVLVRGVQVDDDIEFYHEFREWLGYARACRTRLGLAPTAWERILDEEGDDDDPDLGR
jgi:hypothetical protein